MSVRGLVWILIILALSVSPAGAAGQCHLLRYPPIPVTMLGWRPTVPVELDGAKTRLLVDTGAYVDTLSPAEAAEFKLPLTRAPFGYYINGGLGNLQPKITTVRSFKVGSLTFPKAIFLVAANDLGDGIAGVLGENLYQVLDVEFDFANGTMRFVKPADCDSQVLAYWAAGTGQSVSALDLERRSIWRPQLFGTVEVNGHTVHAVFDTGATTSFLSLAAAKRVGLAPGRPGMTAVGTSGKEWSARIDDIRIGDNERIEHTRILVEDYDFWYGPGVWMFIGADFFLSHHVYLATSQSRLYFTYNGGRVFDLDPAHAARDESGARAAVAGLRRAQPAMPAASTAEPPASASLGAADLMRRGLAHANRLEFQQAIADLTQACRLAPRDAEYRYRRGVVYWRDDRPDLALRDFDAAIELDASDFRARLWRAEVRLLEAAGRKPDPNVDSDSDASPTPDSHGLDAPAPTESGAARSSAASAESDSAAANAARADLEAVDRLAPPEADLRMTIGRVYESLGDYPAAIHQYDLWITYHPADYRLASVLTWRCGSQAEANLNLDRALRDCDRTYAVMRPSWWSSKPKWPAAWVAPLLTSRSVVELRQGNLRGAIADDDAAIKLLPADAYALYCRALAELRQGSQAQGRADLASAEKIDDAIAGRFAKMGLAP